MVETVLNIYSTLRDCWKHAMGILIALELPLGFGASRLMFARGCCCYNKDGLKLGTPHQSVKQTFPEKNRVLVEAKRLQVLLILNARSGGTVLCYSRSKKGTNACFRDGPFD